jgi:hypothetical protein
MMRVRLAENQIDSVQPGAAEELLKCLDVADLIIVLIPDRAPIYAREIGAAEEVRG